MSTTPVEELVRLPESEPRLKTTSDDDSFLIQKRHGNKYKIICLDCAEVEKVFAALGEWLDRDS